MHLPSRVHSRGSLEPPGIVHLCHLPVEKVDDEICWLRGESGVAFLHPLMQYLSKFIMHMDEQLDEFYGKVYFRQL